MILDVKLSVPKRENNVFLALIGSGVPEPVLVMLLSHMTVNDNVLVEAEEDGCEYEMCKVYQQDLGDHDRVAFFEVPIQSRNEIEYEHTYMAWIANGALVELFRLVIVDGMATRLELGENWGESWTTWARKENGRWKGAHSEDRINDFVMHRLVSAAESYMEDIAKA